MASFSWDITEEYKKKLLSDQLYDSCASYVYGYDISKSMTNNYNFYKEDYKPKQVFFNGKSTAVIWKDGSKTVVHCSENEPFVEEVGVAMATIKKIYGNRSEFLRVVEDAYRQKTKAERKAEEELKNQEKTK